MPLVLRIENVDTLPDGGPVFFEIDRRGIDIGRDTYLDWTLPDPERFISGKHCEIHYRDNGYWLHDVSTNGTSVNGKGGRVTEPVRLAHGDRIHIGHYIIIAELSGEAAGPDGPGVVPNKGGTSFGGDPWGGIADTAPAVDKRDFSAYSQRDSGPSSAPMAGDLAEENISWGVGNVTPADQVSDAAGAVDSVDWSAPPAVSAAPPADDFDWGAPVSSAKSNATPPDWRAGLEPSAPDPLPEEPAAGPDPAPVQAAPAAPEPAAPEPVAATPEPAPEPVVPEPVAAVPEPAPEPVVAAPEPTPKAPDAHDWRSSFEAVGESVPDRPEAAATPEAAPAPTPDPRPEASPEPVAVVPPTPEPEPEPEPKPVVAPEPPEPVAADTAPPVDVFASPDLASEAAPAASPTPEPAPAPEATPTPVAAPPSDPAPVAGGGGLAGQWAGGAQPAAPEPAPTPAAAPVATGGSLVAAFERGAGMPAGSVSGRTDEAFGEELGVLFKTITQSLQAMLLARAETKSAMRSSERTMIGALENNPLKFSPTPEDALRLMFGEQTRSYLNATQTIEDSFGDLQKHQMQTFGAMQQALQALIEDLDPENIAQATSKDGGLASIVSSRRAKYWDTYVERFKAKSGRHERGMIDAFMILFAEMYDRQG